MFEYKCVGAPERARRKRGAKTKTDRVAHAMQDVINREAVEGWEYQRTDLLPVEERSGLLGRTVETHRAVLVFRRATAEARRPGALRGPTHVEPVETADPHIRLAAGGDPIDDPDALAERIKG